jgi:hypothetical protein
MKSLRWFCVLLLMAAFIVPVSHAAVVINELYYDPPSTDLTHEFIELYNNGASAVDLSGWMIEWGGTDFTYATTAIPSGTMIQSGDFLLIGGSMTQSDFGVIPDIVNDLLTFQNGGAESDGVRITNGSGYYDTILYDSPNTNNLPGDDANPGAELCPDVAGGHSLERAVTGVDNNLAADWVDRTVPTPTRSSTAPGNNPPVLSGTAYDPHIVLSTDQVNVISRASDDYGLASVNIRYQVNGGGYGRFTVQMFDDGSHGDGAAGDSIFGGYIPSYDPDTDINFYVEATDDSGAVTTDPAGGPAAPLSYTVTDLTLQNIAAVKAIDANGYPLLQDVLVMVRGLVEASNQFGYTGPAYIRDATGGVAIYGSSVSTSGIAIGDSITVMGWINGYSGLIEISPQPVIATVPRIIIENSGNTVDPLVVTIPSIGESTEGLLLRVNGGHFVQTGNFGIGNYQYAVGTDTVEIYIDNGVVSVIGTPIPIGDCDIIGCLGQYDTSPPLFEGYEILPRFIADVVTFGNQPPAVGNTVRDPVIPTPDDTVWITSRVYDDHSLVSVSLFYQVNGGGWFRTQVSMLDDGLHHDGAAGDSIYGASIPPYMANDVVDYYVSATDDSAAVTTDPAGAPGSHFSYTVLGGAVITPISYIRVNNVNGVPVRLDSMFTYRALVTCAAQLGSSGPAYIQDATGGVAFFDPTVVSSGIAIGDSIELTAWVGFYNGLTELVDDPVSGTDPIITIMSSGNTVTPMVLTIAAFGESNEGQLIRINGGHFVESGTFASTTYHLVVGTDTLDFYIDSSTNIVGNAIPTGNVDVIGCAGQFDATSPYLSGYQLTPRMFSDIMPSTALPAVDDLLISISGSNVILNWTDVVGAADYKVYSSSTPTGPWTVLAPSTSGGTSYTHVGGAAAPASKRFYYVTATD